MRAYVSHEFGAFIGFASYSVAFSYHDVAAMIAILSGRRDLLNPYMFNALLMARHRKVRAMLSVSFRRLIIAR
jgi:hypothetical protein